MRLSDIVEQRAVSQRPPLQTWMVAYQEPPLWREGYKPPSAGHIPGPSKQTKFGLPLSAAANPEAKKLKQHDRIKAIIKEHKTFDRYQAAKVLKMTDNDMRTNLSYWLKLGLIRHTGEYGPNKCFIWEVV